MRIVADENIPFVENYFGNANELQLIPGRLITHADVATADILLVRSVTQVNQALLENSTVKFVGSVTSGADHLDLDWLDQNKIKWSIAQGCNAIAVVEYVICVIAALQKMHFLQHDKVKVAIVGVGVIGEQVKRVLCHLGFDIVLCDPFRSDIKNVDFTELTDLDFISFHTPLTYSGLHPTYHLVGKNFLQQQKQGCILLNASRGKVFSFAQLKNYGSHLHWCFDVWENEPQIEHEILSAMLLGTPHIAGYSLQSKQRGIEMIYTAALQYGLFDKQSVSALQLPSKKIAMIHAKTWQDVVLTVFNPLHVTQLMKNTLELAKNFDILRKKYVDRYEFSEIELLELNLPQQEKKLLIQLGFRL